MFKKLLLYFFIPSAVFIMTIKIYYSQEVKEQKVYHVMDQIKLSFDAQLKTDKMDDLKVALLLASNTALIDSLDEDDEDRAYKLLSSIVKSVKKHTNISIRAQIITKDLNILARSWDDIYAGMPLGDYREDLQYFKNTKQPRTSLEIGRRLGIKATVPVYKNGVFLGLVEVISFFQNTTEFLSSIGVDLYVLLDIKYSDSAVLMRDNLSIKDYIISNLTYNYNNIQTLKKIDFKKLAQLQLIYKDKKYIFYDTMYDGAMQAIGKFVFVLPQKYIGYFRNPEDDISYLINVTHSSLYKVLKEQESQENFYNQYQASKLIAFKNVISPEDKQEFYDAAYQKFDTLSKDELIQMILHKRITKKIDGKIR